MEKSSRGLQNQTTLEGVIIQPTDVRYTPTGREGALLMIEHISETNPSAPIQRLELHMPVVALGELANQCRNIVPGQSIRVEGYLNQKRWIRDGKVRWGKTELFARTIQLLETPGIPGN